MGFPIYILMSIVLANSILLLVCIGIFAGGRSFNLLRLGLLSLLVVTILGGVFVGPLLVAEETTENETLNEFESVPLITDDGREFVFEEDTVIDVQQKGAFRNSVTETRYDANSNRAIIRLNNINMYNVSTIADAGENDTVLVFTQYYEYNESSQNVEEYQLKRLYSVDKSSFINSSNLKYDVSEYSYYDGECYINTTAVVSHTKTPRSDRATRSSGRWVLHGYSQFLGYSVMESGNTQTVRLENGWYSAPSLPYVGDAVAHVTGSSGRIIAENVDSNTNLSAGDDDFGEDETKYVVRDANFSATITLYDNYDNYPIIKWWGEKKTVEIRHTVNERKADVSINRPEWVDKYDSSCT